MPYLTARDINVAGNVSAGILSLNGQIVYFNLLITIIYYLFHVTKFRPAIRPCRFFRRALREEKYIVYMSAEHSGKKNTPLRSFVYTVRGMVLCIARGKPDLVIAHAVKQSGHPVT
jgi:hypothetical protein